MLKPSKESYGWNYLGLPKYSFAAFDPVKDKRISLQVSIEIRSLFCKV